MFLDARCSECGQVLSDNNVLDVLQFIRDEETNTGQCWSCGAFIRISITHMSIQLKIEKEPEHENSGW